MNRLVVIEDRKTKERHEYRTCTLASAIDVECLCGASIHPIYGAWCVRCGAKVIQVQEVVAKDTESVATGTLIAIR
jgi:hypothetical protein